VSAPLVTPKKSVRGTVIRHINSPMPARSAAPTSPARSAAEFGSLGIRVRTREQKQAEWDAQVEWYVERILSGCEFSEYGNPCVIEAKRRIALRAAEQLTETVGDPFLKARAA
jgi:hypothetical protein